MRGDVLGIDRERPLERVDRFLPEVTRFVVSALPRSQPAEVEQRLPEQVDDFVVLAEIEPALLHIRRAVLEHAAQVDDLLRSAGLAGD